LPRVQRCLDCPTLLPLNRTRCRVCESRRNKTKNATSYYQTPEWRQLRKTITKECAYCGSTYRVAGHHVQGRKAGGPDTAENLVPLCQPHHSQIEADLRSNRSTDLTRFVESIRPNQEGLFE
jgi:hypothetical protein